MEYIEPCDICNKQIDQMKGEDFFIEKCPKVKGSTVLCVEHYQEHIQECLSCREKYE